MRCWPSPRPHDQTLAPGQPLLQEAPFSSGGPAWGLDTEASPPCVLPPGAPRGCSIWVREPRAHWDRAEQPGDRLCPEACGRSQGRRQLGPPCHLVIAAAGCHAVLHVGHEGVDEPRVVSHGLTARISRAQVPAGGERSGWKREGPGSRRGGIGRRWGRRRRERDEDQGELSWEPGAGPAAQARTCPSGPRAQGLGAPARPASLVGPDTGSGRGARGPSPGEQCAPPALGSIPGGPAALRSP